MKFIKIICQKCGHIKEISESEKNLYKYGSDKEHCFICGGEYRVLEENDSDNDEDDEVTIGEVVHLDLIEGMKRNINKMGNDKVFKIIEKFKNASMRLNQRKLFLEAGGEFPITEVKL